MGTTARKRDSWAGVRTLLATAPELAERDGNKTVRRYHRPLRKLGSPASLTRLHGVLVAAVLASGDEENHGRYGHGLLLP